MLQKFIFDGRKFLSRLSYFVQINNYQFTILNINAKPIFSFLNSLLCRTYYFLTRNHRILIKLIINCYFPQYELRLAASDNLKENYTTVVIHVKDVNDNPPVFERPTYRTQITEEDDRNLPKSVLRASVGMKFTFLLLKSFCSCFQIFNFTCFLESSLAKCRISSQQ